MATGIRINGMSEALRKINVLLKKQAVVRGVQKAAVFVKGEIAEYPPVKRLSRRQVYGETFASDKQRRFFFAALRDHKIDVPYRRGISPGSERHGQSWTVRPEKGGLRAVIGSDTSYGRRLQDAPKMSLYAAAVGWKPVQEIARDPIVMGTAERIILREIELELGP